MRRVMVLVVDSFHPKVMLESLKRGKLPALAFLAKNGMLSKAVSTFPTMTPTASATIATGEHCDLHHVPGFIWYDEANSYFVNYGASLHALLSLGPIKAFTDLFYSLNDTQLNSKISTIYEDLKKHKIDSACVNFFIRRAGKIYSPKFHWLMNLFRVLGLKRKEIKGPDVLIWGEVVKPEEHENNSLPKGMFNKFGVNDKYTSEMVSHLIRSKKLPQFSLVFFPDNDRYSHVHGPNNSHPSIENVDRGIGEILSAFGSWEQALKECHFVVLGDHAQSFVEKKNILRLDKLLGKLRLSPKRFVLGNNCQAIVSANERMAAVNIKDENLSKEQIIELLSKEKNIGLLMWKEKDSYCIYTEGKELTFKKGGEYQDIHGSKWEFSGDLSAISGTKKGLTIEFDKYPDAFERIAAALDFGSTNKILMSAPLGFEYYMPGAPIHPDGGSHGSLHFEDSVVPVISAGQGQIFTKSRTRDIKQHVMEFFS